MHAKVMSLKYCDSNTCWSQLHPAVEKNIALVKVTTSHSFGLEVNETKQEEKKRNGGRDRVIVREMVVGRLSS